MFRACLTPSLLALLCALAAAPAGAAITRTYVASYGSDTNTAFSCDFAHPCRTFQTAFSQTTSGGEILVVDGSGYGTITIDRSVSIIANPGVFAGIGVFDGGTGVMIATAGIKVTLRGLTINGQGGPSPENMHGIKMTNGARLSIENCVIANFSPNEIYGLKVATAAQVRIVNSLFRDNSYGASIGGGATASISGSQFFGNPYGIWVFGDIPGTTTTAAISETVVSGGAYGILAYVPTPVSTSTVKVSVIRSTVTNNNSLGVGAEADVAGGTATLTLSDSMVTGNWVGLQTYGGGTATLKTVGNNTLSDNNTNTSGTITALAPM